MATRELRKITVVRMRNTSVRNQILQEMRQEYFFGKLHVALRMFLKTEARTFIYKKTSSFLIQIPLKHSIVT